MALMRAKHNFRYANRRLVVGEDFEAKTERDAAILEAAGRAVRTNKAAEKAAKKSERVERRRGPRKAAAQETNADVFTEPAASADEQSVVDEFTAATRYYGRRDLEAE